MTAERLEKSCAYLGWQHAAGAVLDVFLENQRREDAGPVAHKASADAWATFDELRLDVWKRARESWCKRTGLDSTWFPFSLDGTARLYFRFRKRSPEEVQAFRAEIEKRAALENTLF